MTETEGELSKESQPASTSHVSVSVDISELYKFKQDDLVLEISEERYSNLAYIQVAPREVSIDFLPMPGIKKDGKMVIKGTRIYMSHMAAQMLAERLNQLLEEVHEKGGIETYRSKQKKEEDALMRSAQELLAEEPKTKRKVARTTPEARAKAH